MTIGMELSACKYYANNNAPFLAYCCEDFNFWERKSFDGALYPTELMTSMNMMKLQYWLPCKCMHMCMYVYIFLSTYVGLYMYIYIKFT